MAAAAADTNAPADEAAAAPADAGLDLILLDPAGVRLFRTGGSTVRLTLSDARVGPERSYLSVAVARAFPLSDPQRFIGLRDGKDRDIGMLASLEGLDEGTRQIVEEELARRYFQPRILRVVGVEEEFGITTWEVETDKGPRSFIVHNLRDAVQDLTPTRVLITDMDGNRFEFPDIRQLDDKSYAILQRVL
jgi:hypothetical protein